MPSPWLLRAVWLATLGLLVSGAVLPMFTFTKFYFFDDTFSLLRGIWYLQEQGEWFLFVLISLFSIALPLYKLALLWRMVDRLAGTRDLPARKVRQLVVLGKWSMLDVFVVALLVVTLKIDAIAKVTVHEGLYLFACGVIGSMALTHWVIRLSESQRAQQQS